MGLIARLSAQFFPKKEQPVVQSPRKPKNRKGRSKLSLAKVQPRKVSETPVQPKPARTDVSPFKQAMEVLSKSFPSGTPLIITTMPRGSLQIAQPARLPEPLVRAYARQYHLEDRLTWQSILAGRAVNADDVLSDQQPFVAEFLRQNGLAHAIAAPLRSP